MAIANVQVLNRSPIGEINTTPLIDVLLVLLVMFVITIPVATNVIEVDVGGGAAVERPIDPMRNRLVVTGDDSICGTAAR